MTKNKVLFSPFFEVPPPKIDSIKKPLFKFTYSKAEFGCLQDRIAIIVADEIFSECTHLTDKENRTITRIQKYIVASINSALGIRFEIE